MRQTPAQHASSSEEGNRTKSTCLLAASTSEHLSKFCPVPMKLNIRVQMEKGVLRKSVAESTTRLATRPSCQGRIFRIILERISDFSSSLKTRCKKMVGMLAKGLTIGPLSAPSVSEGDVKCARVWVHVGGWVCVCARVCAHVCVWV